MESELYETNPQTSEDTNCKRKLNPKITLYTRKKENKEMTPNPFVAQKDHQ